MCAPIVIFTYRRIPSELILSLKKNSQISETDLFIFSDGNKNEKDLEDILKVRSYLHKITGFKSIKIIESKENNGLANSIINGVSEIINKYGQIIVLEDDLVVSEDFVCYMNDALNFYKNNSSIWSISGYAPSLTLKKNLSSDLYLAPRGSSWGWATWLDRWESIDWEIKNFNDVKNDRILRKRFEQGGNDLFKMLELQILGKIDSWAIRWCFSQFLQNKFTVYPSKSKVINNGFDDIGTHNTSKNTKWETSLNHNQINLIELKPDIEILKAFKKYHDLSIYTQIGYFLKKFGGYNTIKKIIRRFR